MRKNIHPKTNIVKCTHSDGSEYFIISTIKNNQINVGNSKERYPWKDTKKHTFVKNEKIEKYNIFDL